MQKAFNATKGDLAPWNKEVANYCFKTGVKNASDALANWHNSRSGKRKGKPVGFPKYKSRHKAKLSVSFIELNHQLSWLKPDRHHVRLMLPQSLRQSSNPRARRKALALEWIHTHQSVRRLYRLVETGKARIQKLTISYSGGRWWASFSVRLQRPLPRRPNRTGNRVIGVDLGLTHLATLSEPLPGLTDKHGQIANPRHLNRRLWALAKLDRQLARAQRGSNNYQAIKLRRARLYASIAATRKLELHKLTNALLSSCAVVAIEDLHVAGMAKDHKLARHILDASMAEFRHQLEYKAAEFNTRIIVVDRFYPSSKTCSTKAREAQASLEPRVDGGGVKAKLDLSCRVLACEGCGTTLDRDINAAVNLKHQALLAVADEALQPPVLGAEHLILAGVGPERQSQSETDNGDRRIGKTRT